MHLKKRTIYHFLRMRQRKRETTTVDAALHLLQCFGKEGLVFFLFRLHNFAVLSDLGAASRHFDRLRREESEFPSPTWLSPIRETAAQPTFRRGRARCRSRTFLPVRGCRNRIPGSCGRGLPVLSNLCGVFPSICPQSLKSNSSSGVKALLVSITSLPIIFISSLTDNPTYRSQPAPLTRSPSAAIPTRR